MKREWFTGIIILTLIMTLGINVKNNDVEFREFIDNNDECSSVNDEPCGNSPPVADAGPDQTTNESDLVFFNGSGSKDPDYDWHRLDVNFASDAALYLRTLWPEGPGGGSWEGSVMEWVNFSSPYPFWISKMAGHLGQGPTGKNYTYYWKMHETGNFTLHFGAGNGHLDAHVYDETNGTHIVSDLFVSNGFQDVTRHLSEGHIYRFHINNTYSSNPTHPNDLDVNFNLLETNILLTPERDSLVYFVNQTVLDLAIDGPGVTNATFFSRGMQIFYTYYASQLNHSEVNVSDGELSHSWPPYTPTTGVVPGEYNDSTSVASDELNYTWDFDSLTDSDSDGNYTNDVDGTGVSPQHIYGDNGNYVVTLTVMAVLNRSASDTCIITVSNVPPSGTLTVLSSVLRVNSSIEFSVDVNDSGSDDIFINWSWGDGTSNEYSTFYNDGIGPDPYPSPDVNPMVINDVKNHTFTDKGNYTISASVDDDDGGNLLVTLAIDVIGGPITSFIVGTPNYTSTITYVKSTTPLDLSVVDQSGTGILYTRYRIDNGTWTDHAGQFFLAGEGEHYVEWYSEDNSGNVEEINSMVLAVDDTPPATTMHPATGPYSLDTVFTLTATDGGSGVNVTKYRIDGGAWTTYSGSFTLTEGTHNVSYYSIDMLDNTEAERWRELTISGEPPPEVETNYKPLIALIFAVILVIFGLWSSKRRPWKGGNDRKAVMKAFVITSIPFVLAEVVTGLTSFTIVELRIPPYIGLGVLIDLAILLVGLSIATIRILKGRRNKKSSQSSM